MDEPWQLALYKRIVKQWLTKIMTGSGAETFMGLFNRDYKEELARRIGRRKTGS